MFGLDLMSLESRGLALSLARSIPVSGRGRMDSGVQGGEFPSGIDLKVEGD